MSDTKAPAQILSPTEGEAIALMGDSYRIVVAGETTGNAFAVIDMLVPPGGGPGPHAHKDIQETFYVTAGEVEFKTEDGVYLATTGSTVTIPKGGLVHCFRNKSKEVARLLCMVTPAGLEKFFGEIGEPAVFGTFLPPPHLDAATLKGLESLANKYGQQLFPPDFLDKK